MADEADLQVYGAITALGYMVENLYALVIRLDGGTAEDARRTRDELLRQFEELPWRGDIPPGDVAYAVRQHGLHRLERMWAAIEGRLAE